MAPPRQDLTLATRSPTFERSHATEGTASRLGLERAGRETGLSSGKGLFRLCFQECRQLERHQLEVVPITAAAGDCDLALHPQSPG